MTTTDIQQSVTTRADRVRSLRSALYGNTLEYFDWTIYATFSPFIAGALFDSKNPTSGILLTLAIFAVAFIIRPIGGLLFGLLADRRGRKIALVWAMMLMGIGSLLLAIIPSHNHIGIWASVALLLVRLLQGFAYGGESSTAYVYVSELAPPHRRGLWSSTVFTSVSVGTILATLFGFVLTSTLSTEIMETWGWRLPFLIGALLAVYALRLRMNAVETEVGESLITGEKTTKPSTSGTSSDTDEDRARRKRADILSLVRLFFILGASVVTFYTWTSFASTYAITSLGMDRRGAFIASLFAQLCALPLYAAYGYASDRFGRKPVAMYSTIGLAVTAFPLAALLGTNPLTLFVAQFIALFFWSAQGAIWPALLSEGISPGARAIGVGTVTSLSAGVFGGTAPYLNTWLSSMDLQWVFSAYLVSLMIIASILLWTSRETKGIDLATMKTDK